MPVLIGAFCLTPNFETLYKSKEIEKWGSGLKRIYEQCMEQGVRVEFKVLKSGFMAVFYRAEKEESVWKSLGKIREETVEKTVEKIISLISENPSITTTELAHKISLIKKGVEWNIKKLKSSGILKRIGSTKSGYWEVVGEKENISGHGEETGEKKKKGARRKNTNLLQVIFFHKDDTLKEKILSETHQQYLDFFKVSDSKSYIL